MQKRDSLMLGLVLFMTVFLVVGHTPMLLAQDNSGSGSNDDSDDNETSDDDNDDLNETDDDDENETEDDEDDDKDKNRTRTRERIKEVIAGASGCIIKMETKIVIEDGKRVQEIKRSIECEDGLKKEISIRIDNSTRNGRIVEKIKYKSENSTDEIEVEAEDEIDLEEESNATHYKIKARLRNGNVTDIKIMPDTASEIALERLRALNFTVQLRERIHNNVPRVVYNIEANKNGRFLGVFKLSMKANAEVDPETGELLDVNTPWWAFLVAQSDEDTDDESDNGNETDTNSTFPVNSTDLNNTNDTNNSAA